MKASSEPAVDWADDLLRALRDEGIRHVATVPDGGLKTFLERCEEAPDVNLVTLTSEEEGVALACGIALGGQVGLVAMQSSGVGNIVNMLALPHVCRIPCVLLVSMRGEAEEQNPWQVPVGRAVPAVLDKLGVSVLRPASAADIGAFLTTAIATAKRTESASAVLIGQHIIGTKSFEAPDLPETEEPPPSVEAGESPPSVVSRVVG